MDMETYQNLIRFNTAVSNGTTKIVDKLADKQTTSATLCILNYLDMMIFCMESIADVLEEVRIEDA